MTEGWTEVTELVIVINIPIREQMIYGCRNWYIKMYNADQVVTLIHIGIIFQKYYGTRYHTQKSQTNNNNLFYINQRCFPMALPITIQKMHITVSAVWGGGGLGGGGGAGFVRLDDGRNITTIGLYCNL